MNYKLGKLPPKHNTKTLRFAKYLTGNLPVPAEKVYREYKTPPEAVQMFGNDTIGDCTCAGAANMLILASCHTGTVVIPTLDEVIALYSSVSGYDPSSGENDNGASMTDVLEKLRTVGLHGHKILAWAKIDHTNLVHRKLACQMFGGTYTGVNLPASAQSQFPNPWEVMPGNAIEGGHCIIRPGYGSEGDDYVTWANWEQKASAAWSKMYVEEEYCLITEDWLDQVTKKTPGGLDLATLEADLNLLSAS